MWHLGRAIEQEDWARWGRDFYGARPHIGKGLERGDILMPSGRADMQRKRPGLRLVP